MHTKDRHQENRRPTQRTHTFRRKPNRLPMPNYEDRNGYLVTMTIFNRRREFNDP
jgi:hypothetical protein